MTLERGYPSEHLLLPELIYYSVVCLPASFVLLFLMVTLYHKIGCLSIHIFVFCFFLKNLYLFSALTVSPIFLLVNYFLTSLRHTSRPSLSPRPFLFRKGIVHTLIITSPPIWVKNIYSCHLHPRCWAMSFLFFHFQRNQRTITFSVCQVTSTIFFLRRLGFGVASAADNLLIWHKMSIKWFA